MAIRQIVRIDEDRCDGCAECIAACAEGAIRIVDGKARLVSDTYCDGLGACLAHCPQGAISIEEREAKNYDEQAVVAHLGRQRQPGPATFSQTASCPGSAMRQLMPSQASHGPGPSPAGSRLAHWPIQLTLVAPQAPFLQSSDLLVCADCVPFTVPDFHTRYLSEHAVVVGCPKLDDLQSYHQKLVEIFRRAQPNRVTVLRMEVPCCGGLAQTAVLAWQQAGLRAPIEVHTIGIDGSITVHIPAHETEEDAKLCRRSATRTA